LSQPGVDKVASQIAEIPSDLGLDGKYATLKSGKDAVDSAIALLIFEKYGPVEKDKPYPPKAICSDTIALYSPEAVKRDFITDVHALRRALSGREIVEALDSFNAELEL